MDAQADWWTEALRGLPPLLELPSDRTRLECPTLGRSRESIKLSLDTTRRLQELAQSEGVTLSGVLSAAFESLLFRYAGQEDFILGALVIQKDGPYANVVPMRADLCGNPSFPELLVRTHGLSPREVQMQTESIGLTTARLDLVLNLFMRGQCIDGFIEFSTDLFEPQTIGRMAGHFTELLTSALAEPETRITDLGLLTAEEQRQIQIWGHPASELGPSVTPMHAIFERYSAANPLAVALATEHGQVTYAELNARANRVAYDLKKAGVHAGDLVALVFRRSSDLIVSLMGVLKSGAAFVPIDPDWPEARMRTVLDDAAPKVVLSQDRFAGDFNDHNDLPNPGIESNPDDPAYVIYTSGSTGKPKGAILKHRGWANLARIQIEYFGLGPGDRVLQLSSPGFDALVFESGLALTCGATLCIARPSPPLVGPDLAAAINEFGITAIALAPSTLAWLNPAEVPSLKLVISAGETLRPEIAELWRTHVRLFNGYGPTETTVCTTLQLIEHEYTDTVPIGKPIANVEVDLLDAHGNPVPAGVSGEVWIGGAGVGGGYLNRPGLTAACFQAGKYRSGDRARWLTDGSLEFQGRKDHQVKIRGFRIELEEVEAACYRHPAVRECAVVVVDKLQCLFAYVVADTEVDLRDFLHGQLPAYMVPKQFIWLDKLPRNSSGKIDLAALKRSQEHVAPIDSPGVRQIWQEVLQVPEVRPGENFFDLGGHSLLAVDLLQRIRERFGKTITLTELLANPTIQYMEEALESDVPKAAIADLWAVQPNGAQPPIFFVHGDFSFGGFYCYDLADHLGDDQPFYAFPQHGPDGRAVPTSIEEMALDHLKTLRQFQPHGPYLLGGLCNGGSVAYELARQLVLSGETVAKIIMVASVRCNTHLGSLENEDGDDDIREAYRTALVGYVPRSYAGPVDLVWPSDEIRPPGFENDSTAGWKSCASDIRIHSIPGTHRTCMIDFMDETAAAIRECLAG